MNFLAHIYLSGDNDFLKIGNFMADSIKGKSYKKYPPNLQQGILLHRKIDTFTDAHPTVFKSSHRLFPKYSHYATVIVDVLYDHFLARDWLLYHEQPLEDFVKDFYALLDKNFDLLPKNVQRFYPIMVAQNWLVSYKSLEGLEKILWQMNGRVKTDIFLDKAIKDIKQDYLLYETEFTSFFEEIRVFAKRERENLNSLS